ncbi:MAG: GreA/GreB family elongation factor, partial [Anaerolinea sp.]|nr:GreA/GreB family elongation factor [Anaerolinea sp.]
SILSSAQLIEKTGKKDVVTLGSKVVLVEQGSKEQEVYYLVGSAEANPREGKISSESPVGKAILGKKKGDKISVHTSDGEIVFTIKSVS